jgi:CubicO group peptidase (beta-lactamase class C family)
MTRTTLSATIFLQVFALWLALSAAGADEPKPASLAKAAPREAGMNAEKLDAIATRMQEFIDAGEIAGAVTLVAKDGRIVHESAAGLADIAEKTPMQTDSMFAVASMTKPITAAAVMVLVDEGRLSLDDPVAKYLPEFKEQKLKSGEAPKTEMTLRHLLTHTSGLGGDQKNEGTLAETAKALAKRSLDFHPGERWQYGPSLSVCGRVVEVVSGQPFDVFLQERFFAPLGMRDTSFLPPPEKHARVARLYERKGDKLESTTHWINDLSADRTPNPSGGLFSTAADMARFYQMMLNLGELDGRRVLTEASVREMTRVQTDDLKTGFTDGNGWGLGWCVVKSPQGVTEMLSPGTFGHGGAFGTQGWVDPERKMIFVLLIQRAGLPNSDASEMRRALQQLAVDAIEK